MLSALIWDVTNVILYRNKWIFDVIHAIMVLLSEMRVTVTAEYYKITNTISQMKRERNNDNI